MDKPRRHAATLLLLLGLRTLLKQRTSRKQSDMSVSILAAPTAASHNDGAPHATSIKWVPSGSSLA